MNTDSDILAANPFEGDFGAPGDRTLKDRLGVARKAGPCHDCRQTIQPGERVRMRSDICDGELMSFRWCALCCSAMALSWTDGGEAWEARLAMRANLRGANDA
jgi:hypothetical protein